MGNYFIAQDFASSPSDEVVAPMSRAAFPVYSRLRSDPAALADALRRMLSSVTADDICDGPGSRRGRRMTSCTWCWAPSGSGAIPLMPWLGLFAAVYGMVQDTGHVSASPRAGNAPRRCWRSVLRCSWFPVLWFSGQQGSDRGHCGDQSRNCVRAGRAPRIRRHADDRRDSAACCGRLSGHPCWLPMAMFGGVKALQADLPLSKAMSLG